MDASRRRFLETGAALGLGGAALAAGLGAPGAAWDRDTALLGDVATLVVQRGERPAGAEASLRVIVERGSERRVLFERRFALTETRVAVDVRVDHPFAELRDGELRFVAHVTVDGRALGQAPTMRVPVRRYHFGC